MFSAKPAGTYLVECYWPGVSENAVAGAMRRAHEAVRELRQHGSDVRFVSSILIPADETVFCLFQGSEPDVRAVSERAGVPFERVLESVHVGEYLREGREEFDGSIT
jgi:uncharacterized protein DUF4242